jgi:hypothetical protein
MYVKMCTRRIDFDANKRQKNKARIRSKLQQCLNWCYIKYAFSTFPYILFNMSSPDAIKNCNSGCCIALSLAIKDCMKTMWGINSFLIPATIPNRFKNKDYLDIAHVAVAVPISENKVYIVDPSFYFNSPMLMQRNKHSNPKTKSKNIYANTSETVSSETFHLAKDLRLNEYQFIPKGTLYNQCSYDNDPDDKWYYFMREIQNPDESIGKFYIAIQNKPFITTTKPDHLDGSPTMHVYIKQTDDEGTTRITIKNKPFFIGKLSDLPKAKKKKLKKELGEFYNESMPF